MQKRTLGMIPIAIIVAIVAVACSGAATTAPPVDTAVPPTAVPPTNTPVPPTNTPVPTDTPAPIVAAGGGDCVVGSWQVTNMQDYMESLMGSALDDSLGNFTFVSQTGEALINFGADGRATMNADNFALHFTIDVSGVSLDMAVTLNGTSSSDFVVDSPGQITFSNGDTSDMSLSVTIGGNETTSSSDLTSFFGEPDTTSTFTYECQGSTMLYTPPVENAIPLTLTRVG